MRVSRIEGLILPLKFAPAYSAGRNDGWRVAGICLFLAVIVCVVFGQTLHYQFVNFDDDQYVYDNPLVQRGLTWEGFRWAMTYGEIGHWHPLTWLSHMLDCQWYGLNPGGHHLTNVLLHTATVILLFLVLRQMTGFLWRSAFVAMIFAIHPLRAESVAWIAERKDVLGAFFFMLTLGAYANYVRRTSSWPPYLLVLFFFALGLLSKNMLVTTPFVFLLLDYWPLRRLTDSKVLLRRIIEKIPFFALTLASCIATALVPEKVAVADQMSLMLRLENAVISYVIYLKQLFFPIDLVCLYPDPTGLLPLWQVIGSVVLLVALSAGVYQVRKNYPYLVVGWLWYAGMLVPVIGLVQISYYAHADRYTYLPHIGVLIALTWLVADVCARLRLPRAMLGGCGMVILAVLISTARVQTSYWQDGLTLWSHALTGTTDSSIMYSNLGNALFKDGITDEAIGSYEKALELNPKNADAHGNLGNALLQKGSVAEAIAHLEKALQLKPNDPKFNYNLGNALLKARRIDDAITHYEQSLRFNSHHADTYLNLGNALFLKRRSDEAVVQYQKALQLKPDNAETHLNLGIALLQKNSVDEAMISLQRALQIKPDYAEAQFQAGNVFLKKDNVKEAVARYQRALQLKTDYPAVQNSLAWILATAPEAALRDGNKAVELAQQANRSASQENPVLLHTLAAAYAETGRFDDAKQTAEKALALARTSGQSTLAQQIERELRLYTARLPYHHDELR